MKCDYEYDESLGKWIIDTDPGVDDSFAIILGLSFAKDNLVCLSVAGGNTGIEQCEINCKKIAYISGYDTPIYRGCKRNLTAHYFLAEDIHGADGLYELEDFRNFDKLYDEHSRRNDGNYDHLSIENLSPLKIIELCYEHENINLLTIGPLTNIATAVMLDPNIKNLVNKVVIMGGSYTNSGNIVPGAEFNFACDPVAAKIVLNSFKNIVIYGWEPSLTHLIKETEAQFCFYDNDKCRYAKQVLMKKVNTSQSGVFCDYGAAVYAFYPQALKYSRKVFVDIVVDSSVKVNGGLVLAERAFSNNCKEVEIIDELEMEHFLGLFRQMVV